MFEVSRKAKIVVLGMSAHAFDGGEVVPIEFGDCHIGEREEGEETSDMGTGESVDVVFNRF